jgi:hypothetical protein
MAKTVDELVTDVFAVLDSEQTNVADAVVKVLSITPIRGTTMLALAERGLAAIVNDDVHPWAGRFSETASAIVYADGEQPRPNTPRISATAYAAAGEWWTERYENTNRQSVPLAQFTREDLVRFIAWNGARRAGHERNIRLGEKALAAMDERGVKTVGQLPKTVLREIGEA